MRYILSPSNPAAHLFAVALEIPDPDPEGQRVMLPAWIPGSYMVRDFARHVVSLGAESEGRELAVDKVDKQTWRCAPCDGPLRIEYSVYAWDWSVRAAALDPTGGFCNGTSVFLRPVDRADEACSVHVGRGAAGADWQLHTAMEPVDVDAAGFGRYRAGDYEELVDHPLRFGPCTALPFTAAGVPHQVVLPGHPRLDADRLCTDLARVCAEHAALFGELPVRRYLFFMHLVGSGYGGLEHRASTVLDVARDSLPQPGDAADRDDYRELLGLCSHEYFHLWNVKRIRPRAFVPYDLGREVHTSLLWAFEGITSYYDDLALCRSGLLPPEAWLERLARIATRVHRGEGRRYQTLTESSFDAWTRFYKADENAPNAVVSYYAKGALAALALDLTIRLGTNDRCSLDDVMRTLWARHGRAGEGVPEDGVERVAQEVSGLDLRAFFDRALRSTEDIDLASLLEPFGVRLSWRTAAATDTYSPHLRATFRDEGGLPRLQQVLAAGPAQRAGLAPGDRVVAVDGFHVPTRRFADRVARLPRETGLAVHVLRDDRLLELCAVVGHPPAEECHLEWVAAPGAEALQRRAAWLRSAA